MGTMSETTQQILERGYRARSEHQLPESRAAFIEAVRKAATEADRPSLAEALCGLAQAERDLENLPAATHHYESAAVLYRELKLPERLAYAIRHEADVLRESGKILDAEPLYLEAEGIYRQRGENAALDLANTLRGLALVRDAGGKSDKSKALWQEARELYAKCKVGAGVAECDKKLAQ
jgi:tetratricopeptide (TPR) repeat protein